MSTEASPALRASRAALLRAEISSAELSFIMEAHDGISAKIVEEAGFRSIWASGLSISTTLGVRDSNEASWTQVLEILEFMVDATTIPILMDGDTGYGNFNNVRRLVRKLCQRNVAGVCIEEKLFPKTNSFIGEAQPLADIDEFCGKIKAAKDTQTEDDFCVVARIEALVAGHGIGEALRRAEAFHGAGADAILVHSKAKTASEVLAFAERWGGRCPLVIVPTMYYATPTDRYREAGISAVIWANHNIRASIKAMREVSSRIWMEESVVSIEDNIATMKEVFELAGNRELLEAEQRYLPRRGDTIRGLVLAASRGSELADLTADRPKCMLDVRGEPLLYRLVSTFRKCGVGEVGVVRGYRKETVNLPTVKSIDNDDYEKTGEAASLACALDWLEGECIVSYGDILFRRYILENLLEASGDIVLVVDSLWRERRDRATNRIQDLASCSRPFTGDYLDDGPVRLLKMKKDLPVRETSGEWIGLAKATERGLEEIRREVRDMERDGTLPQADLPELFTRLAARRVPIHVIYIAGHWLDVDDSFDLARARNLL